MDSTPWPEDRVCAPDVPEPTLLEHQKELFERWSKAANEHRLLSEAARSQTLGTLWNIEKPAEECD
jgi:hypothetical protein